MRFTPWSIGPTLEQCLRKILKPGMRTLECGSGLSTAIFLKARCDHVALEDDARYAYKHDCVIVTPLSGTPPWYSVWPRGPFDVILIDGPSAAKGGRWGFLRAAQDLIGDQTIILVDDVNRPSERDLADVIAKIFGMQKEISAAKHQLDFGRRFAILYRALPGGASEHVPPLQFAIGGENGQE